MESGLNRRRLFGLLAAAPLAPLALRSTAPLPVTDYGFRGVDGRGALFDAQQEINRRRSRAVQLFNDRDVVWNGVIVRELPA